MGGKGGGVFALVVEGGWSFRVGIHELGFGVNIAGPWSRSGSWCRLVE